MSLVIILFLFLGCLLIGIPVAFSLIISSVIPIFLDPRIGIENMSSMFFQQIRSFPLLAIPLYIYLGKLFGEAGITDDLLYISEVLMGKIKGGLAHVNVLASIMFAGISGSSVADVASIGNVIIPAMKKNGYSAEFSATLTAASAAIGNIIPPSILMIIYGAIAQTSVGALFLAGIIPGVFVGLSQMIYSYYYARRHRIGESPTDTLQAEDSTKKDVILALKKGIFPFSIFILIIGGIVLGVFTPTEAGSIAVIYSLIVLFFIYRVKGIYVKATKNAAIDASVIYLLVLAASFFAWVLTYYDAMIPIASAIKEAGLSANAFLIVLTLVYFFLGTFMEPASAMLIFVPLLQPVVSFLEIHPLVVGIITVMAIRIGTLTPPYGLSALMAARIAETSVIKMMKYILTFLFCFFIVLLVLIFFQDIILFFPRIFMPELI